MPEVNEHWKCTTCGRRAVGVRRDAIPTGSKSDDEGKEWATFKPGSAIFYCEWHRPKEKPHENPV